jgi:hypothetical protein
MLVSRTARRERPYPSGASTCLHEPAPLSAAGTRQQSHFCVAPLSTNRSIEQCEHDALHFGGRLAEGRSGDVRGRARSGWGRRRSVLSRPLAWGTFHLRSADNAARLTDFCLYSSSHPGELLAPLQTAVSLLARVASVLSSRSAPLDPRSAPLRETVVEPVDPRVVGPMPVCSPRVSRRSRAWKQSTRVRDRMSSCASPSTPNCIDYRLAARWALSSDDTGMKAGVGPATMTSRTVTRLPILSNPCFKARDRN